MTTPGLSSVGFVMCGAGFRDDPMVRPGKVRQRGMAEGSPRIQRWHLLFNNFVFLGQIWIQMKISKRVRYGGGLFLGHLMQTMPTSADAHRYNKSKKEKQRIIGNIQLKLTGILRSTSGMAMFKIFKLSDVWVLSAGCAVAERGSEPQSARRGAGFLCHLRQRVLPRHSHAGRNGRRSLYPRAVSLPASWQVASANRPFWCYNSHYFIKGFCLRSLSFLFFFFISCVCLKINHW